MKGIKAIFKFNNRNLDLYAINISEDSDTIEIISNMRFPELCRGNVGDLYFISPYYIDNTEVEDVHRDILLQRVEVWSTDFNEPVEWRYVFLKN